jgi:hypothetical protein
VSTAPSAGQTAVPTAAATAGRTDLFVVSLWNLACRLASLAHLLLGQAVMLPIVPAGIGRGR